MFVLMDIKLMHNHKFGGGRRRRTTKPVVVVVEDTLAMRVRTQTHTQIDVRHRVIFHQPISQEFNSIGLRTVLAYLQDQLSQLKTDFINDAY